MCALTEIIINPNFIRMKKILLFTVMCVLGLFGTLKAQDVVTIDGTVGGYGDTTSMYVPIYNNYEFALTQFYYTAEEIDKASGTIESITFKTCDDQGQENNGDKYPYTRLLDIYMINSEEYNFGVGGRTSLSVSEEYLVFSGSVEFDVNSWITIDLNSDFEYEGNNLFICINDYTETDFVSNGGSLFEAFNCIYDFDGLAYRALSKGRSSSKYDPAVQESGMRQIKQVPKIQLTFAVGAEEYLEPSVPTNFKAEAVSESKIKLTWDAAENAQSYNIFNGEELIANVEETSYFIKNLKEGEYCYTISSVNGSKESDKTEVACAQLVVRELETLQIGEERVPSGLEQVSSDAVPFGFSSSHSWIEMSYSASLFKSAINIERLAFDFDNGNQAYVDEIRIYMAEKTKGNATDWVPENELTLVYSDTDILIGEDKWETFELATPFDYKAKNDLIVVVATAKSGENIFMNRSAWFFDDVENSTLYRAGDNESYSQYPTESGTNHYARPVIQLSFLSDGDIDDDDNENEDDEIMFSYDFEDFTGGDRLAEVASEHWTTWSNDPGSAEDATIAEADGNKYVRFVPGNDQVLLFGDLVNGSYEITFDLFVPDGKNGYYNILHNFDGGDVVWALQQYVHLTDEDGSANGVPAAGHGTTHAGGIGTSDIPFVYDTWMNIRYVIDINHDVAEFYFSTEETEEVKYAEWQWSKNSFGDELVPVRKLDAMNFYPPLSSSEYYLDNFTLKKTSGEDLIEISFDKEMVEASAVANDVTSAEFVVENTGTANVDYMAWIDYGVSENSSAPFFINYDENLNDSTTVTGLNVSEPTLIEIGAMFPATAYASSAAGTKVTHVSYPFNEIIEGGGYGILEGSDVVFRIYGQGFNGQPGEVLAEKTLAYSEIVTGTFSTVKLDEPVLLSGFNVWATVSFYHEAQSETAPQLPIAFDGITSNMVPYGDLIRYGNDGPFSFAHEAFQKSYGNLHIRMTCSGKPVSAGWAELNKVDGMLAVGATETFTVDFSTFGLEAEKTYEAKVVFTLSNHEEKFELPLTLQVWGENVEELLSNNYNIYPNPTKGMVTVEGDNINYIAVYNSVGQLVKVVKTQDNIVDMSAYENGVYFFSVVDNNNQTSVQRVVVAK